MAEITEFKEMAMRMSKAQGHINTFAVVTLYYPPAISRLAFDWPPRSQNFWNRTWDILQVNTFIQKLNSSDEQANYRQHAPLLHLFGIKKIKEADLVHETRHCDYVLGGFNRHKASAWREWSFHQKVHLSNKFRLMAGKAILHYYQ